MSYHQRIKLPYRYTAGEINTALLRALSEGSILGIKCSSCELTMALARPFCPRCSAGGGELIDVPTTGIVVSHTTRHDGAVIGLVQLDGTDTHFPHVIEADAVEIGLRVRARFAAGTAPEITAIEAFEAL